MKKATKTIRKKPAAKAVRPAKKVPAPKAKAKKQSAYERGKEAARDAAVKWQKKCASLPMSYYQLSKSQNKLEKLGKRYGLLREFRENGIL